MFKRSEYKQRLAEIGLTKAQTKKLRAVLEEMMTSASRTAHKAEFAGSDQSYYFHGKADGINAVYRFLSGDMDAHDEFEEEDT